MLLAFALTTAVVAAVRGMWSPCGLSMLSSLNPLAERGRGHRYWLTASWYLAGATVGGAVLGGGLALAAWGLGRTALPAAWTSGLACAAALVAFVSDSTLVRWALPVHPRQVDEHWLTTYRRWVYAGGYGVQIGSGFATYIMTAAVYLAAALAVLGARPLAALLVGVAFGVVRGAGVLVTARAGSPHRLRALLARVDTWSEPSMNAARVVEATVAICAAGAAGGPGPAAVLAAVVVAATATRSRVFARLRVRPE